MQNRTFIFLSLMMALTCCTGSSKVNIFFTISTNSSNSKSLRINIKNNSNRDLMVLSMGRLEKIGYQHPCNSIRLDDFSKISSHKKGDCNINKGTRLCVYRKIEPFNKADYLNLKNELIEYQWFKDRDDLFDYMNPSTSKIGSFPSFILLKAGGTTVVEYSIDNELTKKDKGLYKVFWASKEEIDDILSPKNSNKYKLNDVITSIKKYEYYDDVLTVKPLIFKL